MKLRAALIVDQLSLSHWQHAALREASQYIEIYLVLNCENTKSKKKPLKHFCYYLLNLFTLRNQQTKRRALDVSAKKTTSFSAVYEGQWQKLPEQVGQELIQHQVELVIKFGMGLLRVEGPLANCTIFSYHHGDPSKYRGRPAGFYEMFHGENTNGVIVQKLSNQLDAGEVYAFAETKVYPYSYRKTANEFYSTSKFLLRKAIQRLLADAPISLKGKGRNYLLPSNLTVIVFLYRMYKKAIARICYGVFIEKIWRVALLKPALPLREEIKFESDSLMEIDTQAQYKFYADPFFSTDSQNLRLEALDKRTGLGDIIEISLNAPEIPRIVKTQKHYSYPFSFEDDDEEFLLMEVADHAAPYFYNIKSNSKIPVLGLEKERIVDPTLHRKGDHWYLFFGLPRDAHAVLHLWTSETIRGRFIPHPSSPISLSPQNARMAGGILRYDNRLFRFGQNNTRDYGDSIQILEIERLTPCEYQESRIGKMLMAADKGPHSFNVSADKKLAVIDYYQNRFSLSAGFRRLKARLAKDAPHNEDPA